MINTRPEGKRTGRPKLRWGDSVDHYIKREELGINREKWRKLLKKAKAHAGLSCR
jgi:hypothetical protein